MAPPPSRTAAPSRATAVPPTRRTPRPSLRPSLRPSATPCPPMPCSPPAGPVLCPPDRAAASLEVPRARDRMSARARRRSTGPGAAGWGAPQPEAAPDVPGDEPQRQAEAEPRHDLAGPLGQEGGEEPDERGGGDEERHPEHRPPGGGATAAHAA